MDFTTGLRSSLSNEWTTPRDLFEMLDAEFHFDLDVASTHENALCERHYTIAENGLLQPWEGSIWCNPPYGREIAKWAKKAAESNWGGLLVFYAPLEQIRDGGVITSLGKQQKFGSYTDV